VAPERTSGAGEARSAATTASRRVRRCEWSFRNFVSGDRRSPARWLVSLVLGLETEMPVQARRRSGLGRRRSGMRRRRIVGQNELDRSPNRARTLPSKTRIGLVVRGMAGTVGRRVSCTRQGSGGDGLSYQAQIHPSSAPRLSLDGLMVSRLWSFGKRKKSPGTAFRRRFGVLGERFRRERTKRPTNHRHRPSRILLAHR